MNKLDQAIIEIANQEVPEDRPDQAAARVRGKLFAQAPSAPDRLRNCADFQAVIPSYLNKTLSAGRALLLQDHTRECVACRHALAQARAGVAPTLVRPVTPSSGTISKAWGIAAMALVSIGAGTWIVNRATRNPAGVTSVETVHGILYAVSDRGSTPIFSGKSIAEGQKIRTAKDSIAMVRLPDGSRVEMNERSEISFAGSGHGSTIRLDRGNIIVQAAKQRNGTLDVLTSDCTVSVKGTVFAVDRGTQGSRVTVVEGSVRVDQGAHSQMLKPGEQVSTAANLQKTPAPEAIAWSRDSARYVALLGEFNVIKKGIEAMPSAGLRHDAKLLAYVPDDAILYAAIPNVGTSLGEAERLFQARLQESEVLRTWWDEQKDGPKLREMIGKLRTFSEYLGDEVVFTVSGDWDGNYSAPIILAEVKKPGLAAYLNAELQQLSPGHTDMPEVVPLQPRAPGFDNGYYRKSRRNRHVHDGPMMIGVNDNLMAVAWNQEQLDGIAQRFAEPADRHRDGLFANVRHAYEQGAGWLMCVNMEQIARSSVNRRGTERVKLPLGLNAMRYFIVERKELAGVTQNQATLTFDGGRSGMADWLAEPSPMGSLDFISPDAIFAVSLALRRPQSMLEDVFRSLSDSDPKFEEGLNELYRETGYRLSPNLGEPLGGEITVAVDGALLPLPSWKIVAEVYSPERLQWGIDRLVQVYNSNRKCADCALHASAEQVGGRTFHALTSDQIPYEIHYAFVDGYIVIAPSRSLVTKAIQNRDTGYVLSRSDAFRSQLPRDGRLNFSAIIYHNAGPALRPLISQFGEAAQKIAAGATPGLIYAYGEPDRVTLASNGTFFGLDLNSLVLPSLFGQHKAGATRTR